jgi:prolyl-tRNA editing enzyme YbaK/EbsC (Cys-tRNA(Pro) deacylase)
LTDAAEGAVRRQLEELDVDHEIVACDPARADTAAFCETYGYALDDSANTIVVAGRSNPPVYVACLVLATTRLDVNRVVRRRLGVSKASFASADATHELTGMDRGGVTVFGLPDGLPIWVDARVMTRERIVLGGGSRRGKIVASPSILRVLPGVEIVEGLAAPARADQP